MTIPLRQLLIAIPLFGLLLATMPASDATADGVAPRPRVQKVLRQFRIKGIADTKRTVVLALLRGDVLAATTVIADSETFSPFTTDQESGGDGGPASWRLYAVDGELPEPLTLAALDQPGNLRLDAGTAFKRRTTEIRRFHAVVNELATYQLRVVTIDEQPVMRLRLVEHIRRSGSGTVTRFPVPDADDSEDGGSDDGDDTDGDGIPVPGDGVSYGEHPGLQSSDSAPMIALFAISTIGLAALLLVVMYRRR